MIKQGTVVCVGWQSLWTSRLRWTWIAKKLIAAVKERQILYGPQPNPTKMQSWRLKHGKKLQTSWGRQVACMVCLIFYRPIPRKFCDILYISLYLFPFIVTATEYWTTNKRTYFMHSAAWCITRLYHHVLAVNCTNAVWKIPSSFKFTCNA